MIVCAVCNLEFTPKCHNAKYCSDICKLTGAKLATKKRNQHIIKEQKIYDKTCKQCLTPFTTIEHRKKYCSSTCANIRRNTNRRIIYKHRLENNICPHCSCRQTLPGFASCQHCKDSVIQCKLQQRATAITIGRCRDCHEPAVENKLFCEECLKKATIRTSINIQHRKEQHLCLRCRSPLYADYNKFICATCLADENQKNFQIKLAVFNHYGMECQCCGEAQLDFLSLDHIEGGGNSHRKAILDQEHYTGGGGGITTYKWIVKHNFPLGFQTLCFNCNFATYFNKGVCPHAGMLQVNMTSDYNKLKTKVFSHYGMRCNCCGENNYLFLSIDHVLGDGAQHRREENIGGGNKLYLWLVKNNYPSDFQLLCHNCNQSKGTGPLCAHKNVIITT